MPLVPLVGVAAAAAGRRRGRQVGARPRCLAPVRPALRALGKAARAGRWLLAVPAAELGRGVRRLVGGRSGFPRGRVGAESSGAAHDRPGRRRGSARSSSPASRAWVRARSRTPSWATGWRRPALARPSREASNRHRSQDGLTTLVDTGGPRAGRGRRVLVGCTCSRWRRWPMSSGTACRPAATASRRPRPSWSKPSRRSGPRSSCSPRRSSRPPSSRACTTERHADLPVVTLLAEERVLGGLMIRPGGLEALRPRSAAAHRRRGRGRTRCKAPVGANNGSASSERVGPL